MVTMTFVFDQAQHGHLVPYIAALHASCITLDNMVGPFLPPLTNEKLLPWWKKRIAETQDGSRVIVLLLPDTTLGKKPQGTDLRGIAMVRLADDETGAFRGHIDAVLVDRRYRRQGGAKALVMALEYEASKRGRSLLLVDTETDSVAELAFKNFGYIEIGKVPHFSRSPANLTKGETFFYKEFLPSPS
ncbi:hypothetical protein C8A05DRAFT_30618 [Staphylotrichum tortipilum]|uniref:N-acetyltransferase domain-containing protein n=1 Tax=Staphylotrichum tortipilum TaxID=2831512 RepID=A0AAN6RW20_9PEZI|nr:hypothetical protein C8A05DRAFT_30618 [Staphylotrichum longicolle]